MLRGIAKQRVFYFFQSETEIIPRYVMQDQINIGVSRLYEFNHEWLSLYWRGHWEDKGKSRNDFQWLYRSQKRNQTIYVKFWKQVCLPSL